jgi:serine/threonine-protein kinase HipA
MIAEVQLWGRTIGAVSLDSGQDLAAFEYASEFVDSGIQLSPLHMPLARRIYTFPGLSRATFQGLPGLLADSLPDRFGHTLIDAWLATQGRSSISFSAVERLCYVGARGMGALEFKPVQGPQERKATTVSVDALVQLAAEVLSHRNNLRTYFQDAEQGQALRDILSVGTSAGGARAKAVIAWNRRTNEVRSGQVSAGRGFDYWLLKFDGVAGNRDKELEDPQGYGAIEYAYYLMATAAGISMSPCRLLEENGRRHFMTRRFDRLAGGAKLHMQSLGAMAHFDFNQAGAHSYEQALLLIRQLKLPIASLEEQFRRMAFNIISRNQNDHVKHIAFLMNQRGQWSLAPAFDVTYSYNPSGSWTATHQMSMNGKRDGFTQRDFLLCARVAGLPRSRVLAILEQVHTAVRRWPEFAEAAQLSPAWQQQIARHHRLNLPAS